MQRETYRRMPAEAPYCCVTHCHGHIEVHGQSIREFGHRIPAPDHDVADGIFARWEWKHETLVVNNDRYGLYPIFWFRTVDGGICVSPSIVTLIQHGAPTRLDTEALSVFFRLGFFVGNDTPFAAIKTVPPNAVFTWTSDEFTCRGRYPPVPAPTPIPRDDAIDTYIELFAAALARRMPKGDRFAVPVSGGRDSRHILLELCRIGARPDVCVSAVDNPPDPNRDPVIASRLCQELGVRCRVIDQQLSLLSAQRRKNLETHFCTFAHGWYLALADQLNGQFDCVYDGIAGDVMSQSSSLAPRLHAAFRSGNSRAIAIELLPGGKQENMVLQSMLGKSLGKAMDFEVFQHRLAQEIEKHLDAPNPIASFKFWNHTRRTTALAPYGLLHAVPVVYAPYLDHELFDFLARLPACMLMDRSFHTDAIARAYPKFAHIGYANNKLDPPTDDRRVKSLLATELAHRFLLRRPSSVMKNVVPRLRILAALLSRGRIGLSAPNLIIYLDQIEAIMEAGPSSSISV